MRCLEHVRGSSSTRVKRAATDAASTAGSGHPGSSPRLRHERALVFAQHAADQQERRLESRIVNVNGELIQLTNGTTVVRVQAGRETVSSELRDVRHDAETSVVVYHARFPRGRGRVL